MCVRLFVWLSVFCLCLSATVAFVILRSLTILWCTSHTRNHHYFIKFPPWFCLRHTPISNPLLQQNFLPCFLHFYPSNKNRRLSSAPFSTMRTSSVLRDTSNTNSVSKYTKIKNERKKTTVGLPGSISYFRDTFCSALYAPCFYLVHEHLHIFERILPVAYRNQYNDFDSAILLVTILRTISHLPATIVATVLRSNYPQKALMPN